MIKRCTICKQEKPLSEFNKNSARKDGLQTHCRECNKERSRQYYKKNKKKHLKEVYVRKRRNIRIVMRKLMELLNRSHCADCSIKDARVLEFHHRDSEEKEHNISDMLNQGFGWNSVSAELEKCEILCANCHRIRHLVDNNSYRVRLLGQ